MKELQFSVENFLVHKDERGKNEKGKTVEKENLFRWFNI